MLIFFASMFIVWKILWYIAYCLATSIRGSTYSSMKWKMVKDLYQINPKRFFYGIRCVDEDMNVLYYKHSEYTYTPIMLSFYGYQMLRIHYLWNKVHRKRADNNAALEAILRDAQRDVQKELEKANQEIEKGLQETRKVIREWK